MAGGWGLPAGCWDVVPWGLACFPLGPGQCQVAPPLGQVGHPSPDLPMLGLSQFTVPMS